VKLLIFPNPHKVGFLPVGWVEEGNPTIPVL
jgi:hypothetical protein